MGNNQKPDTSYLPPMGVGVLLLLYAVATWLMSDGEANPALIVLAGLLGVCALGWGFYRRERVRS